MAGTPTIPCGGQIGREWIYPRDYSGAEILLINVPQRHYTPSRPRDPVERVLPPIGLAYLATYLERQGVRAAILDGEFFGLTTQQIVEVAAQFDVASYGINCYSPTASLTYEIAWGLRETGKTIYLGGVHATYCDQHIKEFCPFATIIKGYGEKALHGLLTASQADPFDGGIDPLSLWLSREHLASDPHQKRGFRTSCLLSSRGCPFTCTFCTSAQTRYHLRDVLSVAEEVSFLSRVHQVSHFQFLDDLFLLSPSRSKAFSEAFSSVGLPRVTWQGLATVRTLHLHHRANSIAMLRDSGCTQLSVGFESGSPRIREVAGKQYEDTMALEAVEACCKADIRVKGFFMVGFPGERREEIQSTIDFIFRLKAVGLCDLSMFQVKLYPGTQLLNKSVRELGPWVADDYYEYDLHSLDAPVAAMRSLSRESYGTRTWLSELAPNDIEDIISETTTRFYEH